MAVYISENPPALKPRDRLIFFMSQFQTIAKVGSIPEDSGITLEIDGTLIALFYHQGKYSAIDDACPHMGASLGAGAVEEGEVFCPWHAWRFDICKGTWCDNPRLKVSAYEVRIVGEDIQICLTPKPDEETPSAELPLGD